MVIVVYGSPGFIRKPVGELIDWCALSHSCVWIKLGFYQPSLLFLSSVHADPVNCQKKMEYPSPFEIGPPGCNTELQQMPRFRAYLYASSVIGYYCL